MSGVLPVGLEGNKAFLVLSTTPPARPLMSSHSPLMLKGSGTGRAVEKPIMYKSGSAKYRADTILRSHVNERVYKQKEKSEWHTRLEGRREWLRRRDQ